MTDTTKTLEKEINDATSRISTRTGEIETQLTELEKKINTYTNWAWGFVWIGIGVSAFGIISYFCHKPQDFGLNLLGDFLAGSVASVWSLAGLFFIYVAFLGQKQQLLNQQLEIMYSQLEVKYTRLELEGQKQEMIEQNSTLRQQRFENTFFQLLRNHQDIVNGIDIRRRLPNTGEWSVSQQGRDCFKVFYDRFTNNINKEMSADETNKAYMKFYHEHQSDLGHYFRNLYHILKFINGANEVQKDDKFKYTSLLRALLSSYELALLFHNCIGDYGKEFFKPLVERYSFLKNLDDDLIKNSDLFELYDPLAFASSTKRAEILAERAIDKKTTA